MAQEKIKVGVIGCGTISGIYLENMTQNLDHIEVTRLADLYVEKAEQAAKTYGIPHFGTVEELLADEEIQIVVNLTIPAVHYQINKQVLEAGKSVYCEKPLAMRVEEANELLQLAQEKGVRIGGAPDTFMGPGLQTCRKLIDEGAIGTVTGFTANLVSPGHELWHPAPVFYYQKGAGPMMDMGPYYVTALVSLLGPVDEVTCYAKTTYPQREIQGKLVDVEVLTHYDGLMRFKSGVIGNIKMSFDVWHSQLPCIEFYGTKGTIYVPDPNTFEGPVKVFRNDGLIQLVQSKTEVMDKLMALYGERDQFLEEIPVEAPNMRGLGVQDMAQAILNDREGRADGQLTRHVLETLVAFELSQESGKPYHMTTTCQQPQVLAQRENIWNIPD